MKLCFWGNDMYFPSGPALCVPSNSYAIFHLCHYWYAGNSLLSIVIISNKVHATQKTTKNISNRFLLPKVFGSQAFEPDSEYNRHNHFQTFMAGLLVLFRWVLFNHPFVLRSATASTHFSSSSFLTTCYDISTHWNPYHDHDHRRRPRSACNFWYVYVVVILTVVIVKLDRLCIIALLPSPFPFVCTAIQFVYRSLATSS